uniref:dynein heavy chain domain-containing protein 1 isoform X1 n=1 Tax=Ictidomys tridecemlineatus TaxID=43179 RepID=UPI001A9E684F|nr:dynein heavy chain domain-containing protein 1 isoform X1 [Ictidomys tridecemlineatus]XP_040140780.1 dynein heavy chain domain-containing protein 1 isoform X1 [Ictidomys tridecemlineatus]
MKPHQQIWHSSFPSPPIPGKGQQQRAWNWQLPPELWARSLRQQLNAQLLLVLEEKKVGVSPDEVISDAQESWHSICGLTSKGQHWAGQKKQRQFSKAVTDSEQPTVLKLLLAELQSLFSAVLQDCSPAAWCYLHGVLELLPPYRELLVGHLDLLPFLEQLYCWAPWVKAQLHLDLLDAITKAFPPDSSLLDSASHVDCHPQKKIHQRLPCSACPFVLARWGGQQVKEQLATWLRPVTLPELQRCLGIVGTEVALEEANWLDGLSLLPLALATDIPVQYETCDADISEEEPDGRRETESQLDYEVPVEKALPKRSTAFLSETSFLGSQVMTILNSEKYLKSIHFFYLNVAPSRYFMPYNLIVVPPNKVNPEHYIFSPFGILHVHPVEGSETMTLGTWHRHSVLWQKLQFIPFFKNFLLRKALTCWKKNVKLQGLCRLRNLLGNQLLLAVPHFGAGLLHINRLLQEFHSVSWLPQEPDRCYELQDLQKALAKENYKALRLLNHFLKLCTSILKLVHEDTYNMQQKLQEYVQNCNKTGQGSIYTQRVQCQKLKQKLKQAETWLLQLGKLARLINYMICQSLVSILEDEITSFVANILQAPRQKPFLVSRLVFSDDCSQLSQVPCIENMTQIVTGGLQSIKNSALQVMQSADLKTSRDLLYSEEDDEVEEEDSNIEFLKPKFLGQPSNAVRIFCGPRIGLVKPWKSQPIADLLEVHGHRLRGQYLPPNYNQLQEDLDNNLRIHQALNIQHALMEDMLWEVQDFCREHHWITDIYKFLKSWGPQKLEDMRGCPIKNYIQLVSSLNDWQTRVSNMPIELLTRGKLLLLSCHNMKAELESKLDSTRKDILAQVQNESRIRSQKLMTELTDFVRVFQIINSDIHAIARCCQKLNEANEQYIQLEERMEYIQSLLELIRNHFSFYSDENEKLDISVRGDFRESAIPPGPHPPQPHLCHFPLLVPQLLDMWEAFQFERSQASEILLSKQHAIVPKLQQLMAAALAQLEGLLQKALSGPFMDPEQEQRSIENQLIALEHQYQDTVSRLNELHHAYVTFTGDDSPVPLPICGTRPIVLQQHIWHLYRVISENISEWKCMAFAKFNLSMAREKTNSWLTEAARMSTTLGLHSPVLQRCMRMLEEFRSYLPLLTKLGSLQLQNPNYQSLLRALGLNIHNMELLTLGQLLACPLLEFADRINQVWQCENERIHAQESLKQLQKYWETCHLRLLNFILHVPYEPPASEHSKRQALRNPQWEIVGKDSGTFILSDYSSLQDSIHGSLQTLFKILAIQKSGDLHKVALEWVTIMNSLSALLEVWVMFQQKWIFINKVLHEMKIQFPSADLNARFKVMDDQYRTLMRISVADPMVLSLIMPNAKRSPYFQGQHLQQMLQAGSVELESIIMALESVLYGVCAQFPRLFFLSDSELVALLAAPLESCEAQMWVKRCFSHVRAVNFQSIPQNNEKNMDDQESSPNRQTQVETLAVLGEGGEEVKLQQPLLLHPDLPKWLASLEKCLRLILVHKLQDCVAARLTLVKGEASNKLPQQNQLALQLNVQHWLDLIQAFPWQCILIAEEVVWRAEMEEALLEWGSLAMTSRHIGKLEVLVQFIRAQRSSKGGQPLPSVRQASLFSALLVMAVTHRDIAQLLEKHHVSDLTDFHWARQIKYHLGSPHLIPKSPLQSLMTTISKESSLTPAACWIDVLGRSFLYNYEYFGPRLRPLPSLLPERPVLVLLLALEEVACGTLLGPDGVGKKGLVNSLAQALGRQLVMMPCLPQTEVRCLSNYLNGALQGGAWLLLEAVHHLPPGLLSALGQRLAELQYLCAPLYQEASQSTSTIDPTKPQFLGTGFFEKHHVSVCFGYGCLLTLRALSPVVPANLHLLLRPVALALPDLQRVAELTLLGAGVRNASLMATRLSKFFSLERELVSGHLPCRLPLLKKILEDTIQTLNETNKEEVNFQKSSSQSAMEEAALLRALLHSPLFSILDGPHLHNLQELLSGIFPSASQVLAEPMVHRLMKPLVVEELRQVGLYPGSDILGSLEQLSQALSRASGILLLGPAGSGKTACWNGLFKIQNRLAALENTSTQGCQPVEITHLYPSVLSSQEFLGNLEGPCWHHGVFPRLLRAQPRCNSMGPKEQGEELMGMQHWIVCDGASSAAWLDSITCLLSDSSQLSLPNGQQIARPPGTFFLMEIADAKGMSPTVVGHCALVWCGGDQTWQCMLSILMTALPHEYRLQSQTITELNHLAEVLVPATFRFLTCKHASSLLQVHGQQAVCPGVAEVTSLARILRGLLDPHLRLDEEKKAHSEDLSSSDPVAQHLRSSKSGSLNQSQADSDDMTNKHREHLLVVSSFLFALIWGFGAHLHSRLWPLFDTFMRSSISCISNYPEPPQSASVFDLHVNTEDGTLVPFTGQYLSSRVKGTLGTFYPSTQTERLLYVVDLLLSRGQPVLLAGEAATGKSAFLEALVKPNHSYISSNIHPAFSSAHLRLLLSRGIQGQAQASPWPGRQPDNKSSLLFLLEDLHLATSDPEKSCQPVLETLRQAMDGTVYAHSTLELQTLQPIVNFLATATVPGCCERPLCPRLSRLFTVLALESMTQATMLSRHVPSLQAWLERFPFVERESVLARALVRASVEAWEAMCNSFMPSPLHPHYHFSLHSVSHLLGSLQLLPTRIGSRGFVDFPNHQEHLRLVSGLRGTRLTTMMAMRSMVRLWLHEAQRTFCDRLNSPKERSFCAKLLLEVAQNVFCGGPGPQYLDKDLEEEEEEEEEERVPEVESEGELAQWEDLSNSNSETDEEEDPYGLQATAGLHSREPSLAPSIRPVQREIIESTSHKIQQEESKRASHNEFQSKKSKSSLQKSPQIDLISPLLLPVLLLCPQEKPSDLVFSQELILGSNSESPNLYLERQWESLEKQLSTSAAQLGLSPHLAWCHSMAQHVARLVRVLAKPRQHGLLLSGTLGTGRCTAITLASNICQARLFHLPSRSEEEILQCLRDASWHAGILNQPVVLLVPKSVDLTTLHHLVALATSGSFPDQYTDADLDNIEEHVPMENLDIENNTKKGVALQWFYQQVCSHLHMFFLMGDYQAHKQLPSTLYLRLVQLATASIDYYEPWDQTSLVRVAQHHLEGAQSLPLDDDCLKYPDLQASISSVAKAMALIHLSAAYYHEHLCPALPLVTPKTFLDLLDTFMLLQRQMTLKLKNRAQRIYNALENLKRLIEQHSTHNNLVSILEQQLKGSQQSLIKFRQQLEQSKLLYKRQIAECRHQEHLIENLAKQRDSLQSQYQAFLEKMGKAFLGPLSQLQVADFEEIRSYRAPPESVVRVTDALCELFHHETGWTNAKQLLCTEDFYQELVFFPKEKMKDSELIKLEQTLKDPGMSDAALRAVSIPTANLAIWLRAVLRYGLAQRRGVPTGLLLRQVEATLAREQARLGQFQFQAQDMLENILALTKKIEDAQISHSHVVQTLNQAQCGQYHKWPIKSTLLTPMNNWCAQLQKLRGHCKTMFGDALLCSAAITYLGPFPPLRRQELLDKWLALCRGYQETLGPDDVAQALKQKQKSVIMPQKKPLLPTCSPFSILSLLSCESEQYQWDRDLKPQAKSAHLAGLLLGSSTHYYSCRWPLLLDPSNEALIWLNPLPLEDKRCLAQAPTEHRGKSLMTSQERENKNEDVEEDNDCDERNKAKEQTEEQKAEESKNEEQEKEQEQGEKEEEEKKNKAEKHESSLASETQSSPRLCFNVLSGANPELGPQLLEAAASGLPVLLTNMELGLWCQELQWLLQREKLSLPKVQPGFCLYLSTTLPLCALEKVLGYELLKGLNVLDLSLNMEILEEQMLHEILCREHPELETRWQDIKIRALDACEDVEAAEERLLTMMLMQKQTPQKPAKFLRDMVRSQAEICQLRAHCEELEGQKLKEMELWVSYQHVVRHGMALVNALSPLQNLFPFFRMKPKDWLVVTKKALDSMKPHDIKQGEDLASHLLQIKIHLTHQLLGSTVASLGLTQVPLVGTLGALALLHVTRKASKLESLALWPGLATSASTEYSKPDPGVVRPAWLGPRAWQECGMLELLPPFVGLRASLAGHSDIWQEYLSLSSTVLGPAPGPGPEPLSLIQKLILWRVLRPDCLAGALADFTTSLLGRPLDENLAAHTMPLEQSQATQPILILLPSTGHPTAILHPLTVIQKLAAEHEQGQKHLQVIALGSEVWDPVSIVVNTLCQAMLEGYWLVLDNCHLVPHWPRELIQLLLQLIGRAKVVSEMELKLLSTQPERRNVVTVHQDFRLWLIVSAEATASLPAVLTQHCMPVFWDQSLELGRILIDSMELAQQGLYMQPFDQALSLLLLHGLLLHRQLYGMKLQAHRGLWSQVTLIKALKTQEQLWTSLSNPSTAMQELTASVFYGGPVRDTKDREVLISLTEACLSFSSKSWVQPHTPQYLLATVMPSSELEKLNAIAECKAQMHLLLIPSDPRISGLSEGPQAWLVRRKSHAILRALQHSLPWWVPNTQGCPWRAERRLLQRLVQAKRRLESLQALLTDHTGLGKSPLRAVLGPKARPPVEGFLENEVMELSQLVGILQNDLDCLLGQLKGKPPCTSYRCAAVAQALWTGHLPQPWRPHAPAGQQPPWQWLRQQSRRGQQLIRYLDAGRVADADTRVPGRIFHLSAFSHPRRLLLALRWEAVLQQQVPSSNLSGSQGPSHLSRKRQKLNNNPLCLRVENGPNPKVPQTGLLLIGLQLLHAEWDPIDGALQDSSSSQPSLLPPVSVTAQAGYIDDLPVPAGLAVYSCPVYMAGPLGSTKLHSRNILMHLPLPTKLSLATCIQRRVHVCSPPLT